MDTVEGGALELPIHSQLHPQSYEFFGYDIIIVEQLSGTTPQPGHAT
jgi:hypothetical protein